jgi:hypothetical protein
MKSPQLASYFRVKRSREDEEEIGVIKLQPRNSWATGRNKEGFSP